MKTRIISNLAVLALLFTACNLERIEEPVIDIQAADDQEVVFYATCSDWTPDSKTIRQPDGKVWWDANETIGVFWGSKTPDGGYVFVSQNTEPQAATWFSGTMKSGSGDYWAIYPRSVMSWLYQNDNIVSTFTNEQTGVAGSFSNDMYVAVARSSTTDLVFSHPFGGLKFSVVSSGVKRAIMIANGGESIACDQMLIQHDGTKADVVDINNGFDTIYLTPMEGTFVPGEAYYFVALPVQMNSGFTLVLEKTDGTVLHRSVGKSVQISRASFRTLMEADKGYSYIKPTLSFSPDAVSVSAKGGSFSLNVSYEGSYHIDASSCDWITETNVKLESYGKYSHSFKVEANTGAERQGVITVCDDQNCYPVVITQADGTNTKSIVHHSLGMRFTATWCGYCPIMNESFAMAKQKLGDKFEIVNFHGSGSSLYFSPTGTLASQYQVSGYPTGIVDGRIEIENYSPSYASQLVVKAVEETEENYPVNTSIGLSSSVNDRKLQSKVSVYADTPGRYRLTALLLEDGIVASQSDYTNGTQASYVHNNIARMVLNYSITGVIFTAAGNSTDDFEFTVTIPTEYNINKLKILAYVQAQFGNQAVIQSLDYGDWYIDNCRVAPVGTTVEPEVK